MQKVAQYWERLLFASGGGALTLQKCFYYLLDWTWDQHGCSTLLPNASASAPALTITMTSGRSLHCSTIPRIECTQGKRSLAVRAAPDGTFLQEFDFRLTQARHWAANISKSPLTRTEVFTDFHSMWRPAIEYPLAVTSFSRDQCLQLQKAYTGTFLSHMGIVSTTSRALIFGFSTLSGFNLPELWVSQGTSHITYLLGYLNAEDNVDTLLRIMLDTLQLHRGFPLSPLTYPYNSISRYFDPSWLSSTWDFMTEASALLTLSDQWTLPLDRQNDCHLMPQQVSLAATFFLALYP